VEGNQAVTLYETLFVVHPEKAPRVKEFIERFKKIIEGQEGTISQVDEWGMRDLAYKIEKQGRGHYTLLRYRASGKAVEELERNLKLTDGILRRRGRTPKSRVIPANEKAQRSSLRRNFKASAARGVQ
jgi:small subunit ribosomal protein S6